jgi:outer membrane protein insertion porin family
MTLPRRGPRLALFLLGFFLAPTLRTSRDLAAQTPAISIRTITFEGNKSMSAQQIRLLLRMPLEGSEYIEEVLKSGLQRVENAYRDEGFLHVKVGPPDLRIQTLGTQRGAIIQIPIVEGSRYRTGTVSVKNARVLLPESLMQMCPLQKGQPFSRAMISTWESEIEEAYCEIGYIRIHCTAREALNESDKTVDCVLECAEGKLYTVEKIIIVGDASIDRLQFKRHLLLGEGGVFNPEMVGMSIRFLNQMHLYQPISPSDVEVRIDDAKGTVDLTWRLFSPKP